MRSGICSTLCASDRSQRASGAMPGWQVARAILEKLPGTLLFLKAAALSLVNH